MHRTITTLSTIYGHITLQLQNSKRNPLTGGKNFANIALYLGNEIGPWPIDPRRIKSGTQSISETDAAPNCGKMTSL